MTVYAAFIRGINLGPSNKIAMPRLRELAEGLGWADVSTHINSGNVIFTATKRAATLEREFAGALAEEMGKPIDVTVRTRSELARIVADNPYPNGHPSRVNVAFLMSELPADVPERLRAMATESEPYDIRGTEIYVNYTDGLGRSKLAEKFASVIKVSATTRTIGTVTKVLALCERIDA